MKVWKRFTVTALLASVLLFACEPPSVGGTGGIIPVNMPAMRSVPVASGGVVFPEQTLDGGTATVAAAFSLAAIETTNALAVEILQWAYGKGYLVLTPGAPNLVSAVTVMYHNRELIDLDDSMGYCQIAFAGGVFTVVAGYEDFPMVDLSWYGAVMLCNWLTEMRDNQTANVVYVWVDDGHGTGGIASDGIWQDGETDLFATRSGFRLPTADEWEYAARYLGTTAPATGTALDSGCVYYNKAGMFLTLTPGYYWTPGNYASGATAAYTDAAACQAVAVYGLLAIAATASKGAAGANALGISDMAGNAFEWCFTQFGVGRHIRGGSFVSNADSLQTGDVLLYAPEDRSGAFGFRLCRNQ